MDSEGLVALRILNSHLKTIIITASTEPFTENLLCIQRHCACGRGKRSSLTPFYRQGNGDPNRGVSFKRSFGRGMDYFKVFIEFVLSLWFMFWFLGYEGCGDSAP